jgi:hypothetical protein
MDQVEIWTGHRQLARSVSLNAHLFIARSLTVDLVVI